MPTSTVTVVCGTAILLAILGGLFALTWHGSISGRDALTDIGIIAAAAIGALGVHAGVKAGASAASPPPPPPPGP